MHFKLNFFFLQTYYHLNNGGGSSSSQTHINQQQQATSLTNTQPVHSNNIHLSAQNTLGDTQSSSSSSTNVNHNSTSFPSTTSNSNSNSTKQPSNWRLIFYPNGAGGDCKNFLSVFLKYLSDEPVKIQMMFSIVDNNNEDVYVKYTVNKFSKTNDWGFKQLIHKNAILFQKEKFLKTNSANGSGSLSVRVKMRLDDQKHDYIKKLNDNLHYCKLLSENFSQYYYNNNSGSTSALCGSAATSDNNISNHSFSSKSEINGKFKF